MTYPTIAVKTSTNQWADSSYTFSTIPASRVRSIRIHRGRSSERAQMNAGTMDVVLESTDRTYDPSAAALSTGTPIQVAVTSGATTYNLFTGYVDSWNPSEHSSDKYATTSVSATDAFKVLSRTKLRGYQAAVLRSTPAAYYRLGESSGTTMFDSSPYGRDGVYVGTSTVVNTLVSGGDGARTWATDSDYGLINALNFVDILNINGVLPMADVSIEAWIEFPTSPGVTIQPLCFYGNGMRFIMQVDPAGPYVNAIWVNNGLAWGRSYSFPFDAETHHIVMEMQTGTVYPTLYLDGVAATPITTISSVWGTDGKSAGEAIIGGFGTLADTRIDEIAIYNRLLTATEIANHYRLGAYFSSESTALRTTRVLDIIGWPSALRTISSTTVGSVGVNDSDVSALEALRDAETAEQGTLLIGGDGKVIFRDRNYGVSASSELTLSDDDPSTRYIALPRVFDEAFLINEVQVNWSTSAAPVLVEDAASIAQYGRISETITALTATRVEATDLANRRLKLYSQPVVRINSAELVAAAGIGQVEAVFDAAMALDLGDLVTVLRTPTNTGSQISMVCVVEGISHVLTPESWIVELMLSPASVIPWWVVNGSAGVGTFVVG